MAERSIGQRFQTGDVELGGLVALIEHARDPATLIGDDWGALLAWPLPPVAPT